MSFIFLGIVRNADLFRYFRVDLTAANFVHLVEPQWNPMVEAQATDRVHRIGQLRDVVVTRYIVENSIEQVRAISVVSNYLQLIALAADTCFS